jgi:hypothetical protein
MNARAELGTEQARTLLHYTVRGEGAAETDPEQSRTE